MSKQFQNSSAIATSSTSFPPPPPPGAGFRAHSSSRARADRLLSSLNRRGKAASATASISAIDALQLNTAQALAHTPQEIISDPLTCPPASRRAASTGGIGLSASSSRSSIQSSVSSWEPGMPIPPPPPGPPPAGTRSQSLSRTVDAAVSPSNNLIPSVRSRHPPGRGTNLDPIPPTPADWKNEDVVLQTDRSEPSSLPAPLHIDTGSIIRRTLMEETSASSSVPTESPATSHNRWGASNSMLFRSPAVRNRSAKGIRERRSESRNGSRRVPEDASAISTTSDPWVEVLDEIKPGDLILQRGGGSISRLRALTRPSPRNGKSMRGLDETLKKANDRLFSNEVDSSQSVPRTESAKESHFLKPSTPTPPFSPGKETFETSSYSENAFSSLPSRALPTPPPLGVPGGIEPSLLVASTADTRPVSHLLHISNQDVPIQVMPLSSDSSESVGDLQAPESPKAFARRAIERHRMFAEREASATNDADRLHLFSQFMIAESRIRRERYASTFEVEEIMLADLMQGMFDAPPTEGNSKLQGAKSSNVISQVESLDVSRTDTESSSRKSISVMNHAEPSTRLTETSLWNDYVPCLSPIASMSAATGAEPDEMGSRGRAPSRWWESNSGGSNHGDAFRVLERSKRESKYMGLPREARDAPQMRRDERPQSPEQSRNLVATASQSPSYGPHEYPPEKTGWYGHDITPPLQPPSPLSAPYTPNSKRMDISRFVTLPPPYPRHHPAVNNSHPELADIRAVIRSLHDRDQAEYIRVSYQKRILEKRQRADSWCKHQRSLHGQDMQYRIEHNEISQDEYYRAEADIEAKEVHSRKDITQADFDLFQTIVVSPLHSLFTELIATATDSFDLLSRRLFSDAESHSPNLPQEEGDEQPELLEKLTQLKWLFEAREALHRETFDLLSERNDKYKAIVLLPYQQTRSHEKIADAEAFFAKDSLDRQIAFEKSCLARSEDFLATVEANVMRGVEVQLSAFWDIAPSLLALLQHIPGDLHELEIQIPPAELEENPGYWDHPLQYLYSLLGHAEKSSYQFMESQVNLLCLLHEVNSGVLSTRYKLQESVRQGSGTATREWDVEMERQREDAKLTDDLKEKVGVVEGQWSEALGQEIRSVRERAREWLMERGGWDEEAEEG